MSVHGWLLYIQSTAHLSVSSCGRELCRITMSDAQLLFATIIIGKYWIAPRTTTDELGRMRRGRSEDDLLSNVMDLNQGFAGTEVAQLGQKMVYSKGLSQTWNRVYWIETARNESIAELVPSQTAAIKKCGIHCLSTFSLSFQIFYMSLWSRMGQGLLHPTPATPFCQRAPLRPT